MAVGYDALYAQMVMGARLTSAEMQEVLDAIKNGTFTKMFTNVRIDASGGGDYTTLTAAINAKASTATFTSRYLLQVEPGSIIEKSANLGVNCHDWIDIRGWNKASCFVKGGGASNKSAIAIGAKCTVSGLTLISEGGNGDYAAHIDSVNNNGFVLANCDLIVDYDHNYLGIGGTADTETWFINLGIPGNVGVHGTSGSRVLGKGWKLHFWGCTMRLFAAIDTLEYTRNEIDIAGCRIGEIQLSSSSTDYDANPGNDLYNQGAHSQSIYFTDSGANEIGNVIISGSDVVLPTFASIHETCINSGGSDIAAGQGVKLVSNSWSTSAPTVIGKYNGSGIPYGFAPLAITNGSRGIVQRKGFPIANADATGTAIVFGDGLELNSSANLVKLASGRLVAYARAALASGTGTIEVQMV